MVRRDVQDHGNLGVELVGGFQLEARNFEHRPAILAGFVDQRDDRHADIAADLHAEVRGCENLSAEAGGGGLAVRAGDGERLAFRKRAASSSSPIIGQAEIAYLHQLRRIERNAGADDDQVLAAKSQQAVAASLDHDALVEQRGNVLRQRVGAAHVRNRHLRALAPEKERRGKAGLAQSDDQYLFAFEFHAHEFRRSPQPTESET